MYRNWKDKSEEYFREYYKKNHQGKTRTQIQKEDPAFYQALRSRGLLDKIVPLAVKIDEEYRQLSKKVSKLRISLKNKKAKVEKIIFLDSLSAIVLKNMSEYFLPLQTKK